MSKKIVAIGGGEIGRPGYPVETTSIDKEIIKLSGKAKPKLLFIPTASGDSEGYYATVKKHFGRLGCKVDVLYLIKDPPSKKELRNKILGADIIYVGGGNTLKMMALWRKLGIDKLLIEAHKKGIVLSGLSAGAICWFRWGSSDSRKFKNPKAHLIKVAGLGLVKALQCPHYDFEKDRKPELKKMMKTTSGIAIALDNCCAIEIIDEQYKILCSKPSVNAYKVYWSKKAYHQIPLKKEGTLKSIKDLLSKQ